MSEWRPIEELSKPARYENAFLLFAEELRDPDYNPEGVVEGHWSDGPLVDGPDGIDEAEGVWIASVWCGYHDQWHAKEIKPTHYMPWPSAPA